MQVAVSLSTQSEYAALNEEELDEGDNAKHDVDEDGRRGIAVEPILSVCIIIATGRWLVIWGRITAPYPGGSEIPAYDGGGDGEALAHTCQQGRQSEPVI